MTYYGNNELAESFRTVRKNTLATAADIPEDKYSYRPSPDSRSVAELLRHIAVSSKGYHTLHAVKKMTSFVGFDWGAHMQKAQQEEQQLQTKAQILEALKATGDAWTAYLESVPEADRAQVVTFSEGAVPPTKSRFEMCLSVKEHEMHHRAQLMVLQRMLGIVPHLTRERQARMGAAPAPKPAGA
ncbi:MAG: DinB family protein [Acidobacteriota bacterium]